MRIIIPLNPCFVLCLSRSHKLVVGGKEENVLIYNEKELNKVVDIVYPARAALSWATGFQSSAGRIRHLRRHPVNASRNMHSAELQIRN
jgi:hypothetical protein